MGNGGNASGSHVRVSFHVFVGVDDVGDRVERSIDGTTWIEVNEARPSQGVLDKIADTLEVGNVLRIARRSIKENTVHVDIVGGILVPSLVDVDIGFHAGKKTVSISTVDVAEGLNVAVGVQL